MLSGFLFVVFSSFYIWLYYKPHRTSEQHQRSIGTAVTDAENPPKDALQLDEDKPIVQIIDKRTPIPEQPGSIAATKQLTSKTESATESVPEVIRSNPPESELVEAARESAPEKDAQAGEDAPLFSEQLEQERPNPSANM
jgi:hypothetical protein